MSDYSRATPFRAMIKERFRLSKEGSGKHTHHIVLDISGSSIQYAVGDSVGIYPEHCPDLVKKTISALGAKGDELVFDSEGKEYAIKDFLSFKVNITTVPLALLKRAALLQTTSEKREFLASLLLPDNREIRKAYLNERELWDFLEENHEIVWDPCEVCSLLPPLLPRFYSIASSQKHVGEEIHLTVSHVQYTSRGEERRGVCSNYLCHVTDTQIPSVPIYIQPAKHFRLPEDPASDLIMVGPGTGIAPFRGFIQERLRRGDRGKNWLFFGEQRRAYDFLYEEEWLSYERKGFLRLDTAFSRDQEEKVYVQDKMRECGEEIYRWIDRGAFVFVCGDAKKMAKDVEAALHDIFVNYGDLTLEEARDYVKRLRKEYRYQRDVY